MIGNDNEQLAGILMPVASLPSPYGIGDFGETAYEFVDRLARTGVKLWQILPLHPLGYGNSPYQPLSSYAGETLYISPKLLAEEGLLTLEELESIETWCSRHGNPERIQYTLVRQVKEKYYRRAYTRFRKSAEYEDFATTPWVYRYGVFIALRKKNGDSCFTTWPREERDWVKDRTFDETTLAEEISYQIFLQYLYYKQWMALKAYANAKGLFIMGDMPFYVGIDSQDVWENTDCFLLDEEGQPTFVAGVPPDYFCASGQRWGNPIYDWEHLKKTDYRFWINRLEVSSQLFDIIRLDHFRAFDTYWKIPASCETAIEGEWVEAPGYEFFTTLYQQLPEIQLVVEDLGLLRPEVSVLRDYFGFKGMRVLQFTFMDDVPLRGTYEMKNCITYTGTHDNDTITGWYKSQRKESRRLIRKKLRRLRVSSKSIAWSFIKLCYQTKADFAIVPYQDIVEKGSAYRINRPGTVGSPNWEWRCTSFKGWDHNAYKVERVIRESGRLR